MVKIAIIMNNNNSETVHLVQISQNLSPFFGLFACLFSILVKAIPLILCAFPMLFIFLALSCLVVLSSSNLFVFNLSYLILFYYYFLDAYLFFK